jgi:hypothetical protein
MDYHVGNSHKRLQQKEEGVLFTFIALSILIISVTAVVLLLVIDKRQEEGALQQRPQVGPQEGLTTSEIPNCLGLEETQGTAGLRLDSPSLSLEGEEPELVKEEMT